MSREIEFIGSATGTNSADLSGLTIQSGDLILVFAYRSGSLTAPALASGYTNIGTGSGDTNSERTAYRTADGTETSTGTWANASHVIALVYRNHGGIGATTTAGANSTTVSYPALSLDVPDRASHVVAFAGHRQNDGVLEWAPEGMVNIAHVEGASQAVAHSPSGPVGGWLAQSRNIGGSSSGHRTRMVEVLAPAYNGRTFYISPTGNNANNGTSPSTPWATYEPTWGTLIAGDRVLLEGGTTLAGDMIWNTASGTAAQPIIFGAYGLGMPQITAWESTNAAYFENASHIILRDIKFVASAANAADDGVMFWLTGTNARENIKIIDCEAQNFNKRGFFVAANSGAKYDNVLIQGCQGHNNRDMGIFVWAGDDTLATRHTNVEIIDCYGFQNPGYQTANQNSGSGICMSHVDGGRIAYCLAYENGNENNPVIPEAGVGIWIYSCNNVLIEHCESYGNLTSSTRDGGGFDIDQSCTNCTIQYCYAHDNDGPGFMLWQQPGGNGIWENNTLRFNLSENDAKNTAYGSIYVARNTSSTMGASEVHHNTVYSAVGAAFGCEHAPTSCLVRNNIFFTTGTNRIVFGTITIEPSMRNNAYWNATGVQIEWGATTYTDLASWRLNHGQETVDGTWNGAPLGYVEDPQLTDVGLLGAINDPHNMGVVTNYRMSPASPLVANGIVFDPGVTTCFFGRPLSTTQPNALGAHNVEPPTVHPPLLADDGVFLLAGQAATFRVDRAIVADAGSYALTGSDLTFLRALLAAADSGGFTLTGTDADLRRGRVIAVEAGTFQLTGQPASSLTNRRLEATSGPFQLTGQAAGGLATRRLNAASAAFQLAGQDAALTLEIPATIIAASAAFQLAGQDATLRADFTVAASSSGFSLSGQPAQLTATRILMPASGSFTLAQPTHALRADRRLLAEPGAFSLAGFAVALNTGFVMLANTGEFDLALPLAGLWYGRALNAEAGSYLLTGQDATVARGRTWTPCTMRVWEGGQWIAITPRQFDGTTWQPIQPKYLSD